MNRCPTQATVSSLIQAYRQRAIPPFCLWLPLPGLSPPRDSPCKLSWSVRLTLLYRGTFRHAFPDPLRPRNNLGCACQIDMFPMFLHFESQTRALGRGPSGQATCLMDGKLARQRASYNLGKAEPSFGVDWEEQAAISSIRADICRPCGHMMRLMRPRK